MSELISNTKDLIDSRDIVERIEELQNDIVNKKDDIEVLGDLSSQSDELQDEIEEIEKELKPLVDFAEEAENYSDSWNCGATLIHDSYFTDYAQQLAEDIGAIDTNNWPAGHIDWESAADTLKMDYGTVDFNGETYWVR